MNNSHVAGAAPIKASTANIALRHLPVMCGPNKKTRATLKTPTMLSQKARESSGDAKALSRKGYGGRGARQRMIATTGEEIAPGVRELAEGLAHSASASAAATIGDQKPLACDIGNPRANNKL